MIIMRTTPKILKATEKYIASLGRKREELTEEQWNLMLNYIKVRRIAIPFLLFFAMFSIGMTFAYWHQGHKYYTKTIPHQSVKISFDDQKEPITLSPEEVRQYLNYVTNRYMVASCQFLLSIFFLTSFIISMTIARTANRKAHRILLSRPTSPAVEV
jgi:hypothetical protein